MGVLWPTNRRSVTFVFHHFSTLDGGWRGDKIDTKQRVFLFSFQNAREDRQGEEDRTYTKSTITRMRWRHGKQKLANLGSGELTPISYLVPTAKRRHGHGFWEILQENPVRCVTSSLSKPPHYIKATASRPPRRITPSPHATKVSRHSHSSFTLSSSSLGPHAFVRRFESGRLSRSGVRLSLRNDSKMDRGGLPLSELVVDAPLLILNPRVVWGGWRG